MECHHKFTFRMLKKSPRLTFRRHVSNAVVVAIREACFGVCEWHWLRGVWQYLSLALFFCPSSMNNFLEQKRCERDTDLRHRFFFLSSRDCFWQPCAFHLTVWLYIEHDGITWVLYCENYPRSNGCFAVKRQKCASGRNNTFNFNGKCKGLNEVQRSIRFH